MTTIPLTSSERKKIAAVLTCARNDTWPDNADISLSEALDTWAARADEAGDAALSKRLMAAFDELTGR
jgi:hypothetical protein